MVSHLDKVTLAPPDAIFVTNTLYNADTDPRKISLGIGAYRDDDGKPYPLKTVRKVDQMLANDMKLNKEYLGIDGHQGFIKAARVMMFGANSQAIKDNRIATVQSVSGTGGLRLGADFVKRFFPDATVYMSNPTWGNHPTIFQAAGCKVAYYKYWNAKQRNLDIEGMLADLKAAPAKSVILLHACAHNPTGVDPTMDEWKRIAAVMAERQHFPFFDSAYQGFATGDLERDAWPIRYFVDLGFEMLASQSFAKNFGLYNERAGTVSCVCKDSKRAEAAVSQFSAIIRPMYSNPPAHGARIVEKILTDKQLYAEWLVEMEMMSSRIKKMRDLLYDWLVKLGTPGTWEHVKTQIGMFSFTGLTPNQCKAMIEKHHIYLLSSGRISMAGVTSKNVEYLARAIHDVVTTVN